MGNKIVMSWHTNRDNHFRMISDGEGSLCAIEIKSADHLGGEQWVSVVHTNGILADIAMAVHCRSIEISPHG